MLGVEGVSMSDRIAPVVANTNVNYRAPIVWPNDIVVELYVERLGNSSVAIVHRIVDNYRHFIRGINIGSRPRNWH